MFGLKFIENKTERQILLLLITEACTQEYLKYVDEEHEKSMKNL